MTPARGFYRRWLYSSKTFEQGFEECFKKKAYKTLERAEEVKNLRDPEGETLRIYSCSTCQSYHLTKKNLK